MSQKINSSNRNDYYIQPALLVNQSKLYEMRNLAHFSGSIHDEMDLATIIPFSSLSLVQATRSKCVRDIVISLCVWVICTMLDQVYTVVNQFVTICELCLSTVWTLLRTPCNIGGLDLEVWLHVKPDIERIVLYVRILLIAKINWSLVNS